MNPTVVVAILSHPRRAGEAVGMAPILGAPVHLSLHTSAQAGADTLRAAMREEWDREYAHNLGPASEWDPALLSRRMVEDGYLAAVVEREVALDDDRELPFGRLYAEPPR